VLRDVVIDRTSHDELMAVCQAPGVAGETMTLDLMGGGLAFGLKVRVLESRPVIISGSVRHRLRLALLEPAPAAGALVGQADVAKGTSLAAGLA
jgi:hypothetical protein